MSPVAEFRPDRVESPRCADVTAVVVTYRPAGDRLSRLLAALAPQVGHLLVVDNCSPSLPEFDPIVSVIHLAENRGLGAALNIGIERARALGARSVLLLDQDSIPAADMVAELVSAQTELRNRGEQVSAVGPLCVDEASGARCSLMRLQRNRLTTISVNPDERCISVDFLFTSGSLIAFDVLSAVGGMEEELFIDHLDVEWLLRAAASGHRPWGAPRAHLYHELGSRRQRIWLGRWRSVPYHEPDRYYYLFRNTFLLMRRPSVPRAWRRTLRRMMARHFVFFLGFTRQRWSYLKVMMLGVWHGLRGRGGPRPQRQAVNTTGRVQPVKGN